MLLSDHTIKKYLQTGQLVITPYLNENVQPSSIDLLLDPTFRIFRTIHKAFIDIRTDTSAELTELVQVAEDEGLVIHPGNFILGSTVEHVEIPNNLVARLEGRSSIGRLGIVIHSTAGYIDPGFKGNITLEISNLSNIPVKLYPRMRIAQLSFEELTTPADAPYGSDKLAHKSKYQNQSGPVSSRIDADFFGN